MHRCRIKKSKNFDLIETVNALFVAASIFIGQGIVLIPLMLEEKTERQKDIITKQEISKEPEIIKEHNKALEQALLVVNEWNGLEITYETIETEYIGRYFVTAYSDEETWSRETASGVEVHYSEDDYEPTTCAIDPRYHRFGELLMIEGKVYICEDTGGNVKGAWVDCFVETMEEVWNWNTGYKSVYSVEYVTNRLSNRERQVQHERFRNYLLDRSSGSGCPRRNDY